jgi:hypothetical protein
MLKKPTINKPEVLKPFDLQPTKSMKFRKYHSAEAYGKKALKNRSCK